jgi:hypothetical protein
VTERITGPSRRVLIVVLVAAVVVVAAVITGVTFLTRDSSAPFEPDRPSAAPSTETTAPSDTDAGSENEEDDVKLSPVPGAVLPEPMRGQDAIDALGDKIEIVANRNGKTVEQVKELLLRDKTAEVSTDGFIRYVDTFKDEG